MGGPWRVAKSLDTLLAQINAAYPNRSKVADGAIGDAAHAASVSDHNPDQYGVVRARDYTHDPARGFDAHAMADRIVASRDPRIKYVISRGRIASSTISPWVWRPYDGSNRHDHHAHVSVVPDARADSTKPWTITAAVKDDLDMTPAERKALIDDIATAVVNKPVPRPGNTPVALGAQVGGANINAYRALQIVKAQNPAALTAAVVAAVKAAQPDTDVNALAKAIVLELGKDS